MMTFEGGSTPPVKPPNPPRPPPRPSMPMPAPSPDISGLAEL